MSRRLRVWLRRVSGLFLGFRRREADELTDPTEAELEEFLEADRLPDYADPGFKERLREQLWEEFISKRR